MFNIYNVIEVETTSPEPVPDQAIPMDEPVPEKDVFIKVRLDQNEGPAPEGNRYALFYNSYWVHKDWAAQGDNMQSLAEKFPAFVMFNIDRPASAFHTSVYGEEPGAMLQNLAKSYYALVPLIKIRKGAFKFSGVRMPVLHSKVRATDSSGNRNTVHIIPNFFTGVAAHYYGVWSTNPYYSSITGTLAGSSPVKQSIAAWVKKKHKEIDDWLDCTVPELQVATIN